MSTAGEQPSIAEIALRHARCRALLAERLPAAGGLLVFAPLTIYYLTGTLTPGILWLPLEGEAVLLVRKGLDRARAESALKHIVAYRSYGDVGAVCAACGSPLTPAVAAEKAGLVWGMAENLQQRLKVARIDDAAGVLARARAVKSPWELTRMREAGARHKATFEALAGILRPGMSERDIAVTVMHEMLLRGHAGVARVSALGVEPSFGTFACGNNANYSIPWDGPVGFTGGHPAAPFMGSAATVWAMHSPLVLDFGFNYQGYMTDKTQVFWSGTTADVPDVVRRAHAACEAVYHHVAAMLKPGGIPSLMWRESCELVARAGFADGWMGAGDNQVRFVGHGIGLVYDEFPALADRFDEPLEVGMTIAVEPKIALPGIGMVGMENVFEVTERGAVSISGEEIALLPLGDRPR